MPSFDGALKPNNMLEKAEIVGRFDAPEDLATDGKALFIADGTAILRLEGTVTAEVRRFDRPITALCCPPDGGIAVALDGREVQVFASPVAPSAAVTFTIASMHAVNALAAGPGKTLVATDGSTARPCSQWVHDLMERGRGGRVLVLDLESRSIRTLASGLHYAFGVCAGGSDVLGQRKLAAPGDRARRRRKPAHRAGTSAGLSIAAVAGGFRRLLADGIHRAHPIGRVRAARTGLSAPHDDGNRSRILDRAAAEIRQSFLEPMQGAHIKTMGVVKPWAPPRSYGLVIRLDTDGVPLYSLHSRVDGVNHGIVAAVEVDGSLFAIAKGPGRLLRLPLAGIEQELRA